MCLIYLKKPKFIYNNYYTIKKNAYNYIFDDCVEASSLNLRIEDVKIFNNDEEVLELILEEE